MTNVCPPVGRNPSGCNGREVCNFVILPTLRVSRRQFFRETGKKSATLFWIAADCSSKLELLDELVELKAPSVFARSAARQDRY
jgi:hypothetical protein